MLGLTLGDAYAIMTLAAFCGGNGNKFGLTIGFTGLLYDN